MPGGGPPDKPGEYRVVALNSSPIQTETLFNQAEKDGFEFKGMNNNLAVFYKAH